MQTLRDSFSGGGMVDPESGLGRSRPWEVLVNQRAGRKGRAARAVEGALRQAGVAARFHVPQTPEEGRRIAWDLSRQNVVVAALGGDGTVNDIGSQLVGGKAWLAMLPGGTENLMCRSAGFPTHPVKAVERLLTARAVRWDVGRLGHRVFLGLAGVGLDGEICERAEGVLREQLGQMVYWLAALGQVPLKPKTYSVKWNSSGLAEVQQVVFSNVPLYGGGLIMNADAAPTDGWLDMAVFPWKGYGARLGQFLSLLPVSWARKFPGPVRARVKQAHLEAKGRLPAHVDGEPFLVENPSISIYPEALWVLQATPPSLSPSL